MQKIRVDFDNPGLPQHISAVENDSQSRFFQATLYENGKAYTAPEGATYSIMYRGFGPQNQGWYDTINDGAGKRAACAVSGNVVTCEIARQALQVPGHVSIVLCVTTGKGYMLKSWPIECDCKNDRYDSTVEIQSFFYVTQISNESWTQAIQAVEELKNTIDPTLSLSGKAADAAKVGEAVNAEAERAKGVESQIKEDIGDLDYVIFKDKINSLAFVAEGLSSDITLNGNTITSVNAIKEQYKAFINNQLFESGKKYIVVIKFKNDSNTNISVYANAFSYRFDESIGNTQNLGIGKSETSVISYTAKSDDRGFSIYSTTENASYTADIYVYDVTDKDTSKIDFSVGGTKIKILKSDIENPYFGKILCTYGDSITAQQTWQDYVQRELGLSKYYNHGVGGRRLMAMATDECLAEITEDFDIMLVMGGTNDWAQDRAIGTEDDINTDDQTFTGTFYGGLNALMKKLTTKYPTKRIVFMTQTPTKNKNGESFFLKKGSADGLKNSNGDTTRDFAKATLNACGNNHVPCVDLNSLVGWNENNISSFVLNEDDNFFHPTSIGGKRMAECISGFLKSIQSIN